MPMDWKALGPWTYYLQIGSQYAGSWRGPDFDHWFAYSIDSRASLDIPVDHPMGAPLIADYFERRGNDGRGLCCRFRPMVEWPVLGS